MANTKQVDLVIYKGGQRHVIGKAILKEDGSIIAQVEKDLRKDLSNIIDGLVGEVSINPKRAQVADLKYVITAPLT